MMMGGDNNNNNNNDGLLAVPSNDISSLDLNIVVAPQKTVSPLLQPQKKKKKQQQKNNKYERRRQRAKQAKARKEAQQQAQQQQQNSNNEQTRLNEHPLVETVTLQQIDDDASNGSSSARLISDRQAGVDDGNTNNSNNNGSSSSSSSSSSVHTKEQKHKANVTSSPTVALTTSTRTSPTTTTTTTTTTTATATTATATTTTTRTSLTPLPHDNDDQIIIDERAKYMAEFHARPLELDRRAGVTALRTTTTTSLMLPAMESHHCFDGAATEWSSLGLFGLSLHDRLQKALQSEPFHLQRPTVIQSKAIPAFFQDEQVHNVLIQSETGSGKTLAYLLPIVQSLAVNKRNGEVLLSQDRATTGTCCIILCPTRELAAQTLTTVERLTSKCFHWLVPGCLFGEEKRKSEKARIRKGLPIIIATPGRLLDHLTRTESLLLALKGKLQWLVLDEADRLLDMGLGEQVKQIVERIRANQPGSGRLANGITWRSVLVSATVPKQVEQLAQDTLLGGNGSWVRIRGNSEFHHHEHHYQHALKDAMDAEQTSQQQEEQLADSTPRQLHQYHVTVSAKYRLAALVAVLTERALKSERTVVFLSTCASVDFHHALFTSVKDILGNSNDDDKVEKGIFGNKCPIFKLHGNIPHGERQHVLRRFEKGISTEKEKKRGGVLLCTDVAARGLNLPNVDWTIQYDPPSEISDYVHRAGRVARAGKPGQSLLFLLPSESLYLDVLKNNGVKKMTALSLTSILNSAASACDSLTEEGVRRSGGGLGQTKTTTSRLGEAFSTAMMQRFEDCISEDDKRTKAEAKDKMMISSRKRKRTGEKPEMIGGELLHLAQTAFLSHVRAYPTREKRVRHIFSAKSLHLGHIARSFALRDSPKELVAKKSRQQFVETRPKKQAMSFDFSSFKETGTETRPSGKKKKKIKSSSSSSSSYEPPKPAKDPRTAKQVLMANAAKLQANGMEFF